MLNNYADSGGGFNSNLGQTARPTETQKQQNLGTSWSYNSQLEGIYYGSEHQPMYMGPYDGSSKHANYPQYPSGTIHQPVPTPVVQCHEACCQHYENRYPINPAPLRYQPSGSLQPRYPDIPNGDSRQYFPERRPVQVNLPRKKGYPIENGYTGISDRHYSQYMGRGQTLPVDSRQQMQAMRPQYPSVYPHYWGSSRGWTGARMNCPPPSYNQSVNQNRQLQPGTKITDNSQYMDPSLQKSLNVQHQRGINSSSGKMDIIRPVPEPKRPALDSSLQSCYEYGYPTGFLPFNEANKIQGKSLNPQSMNVPCKVPPEKQYHPQQMQYPYQNNERNLISYGNPSNDPSYPMNFPLSSNGIHTRPDLEEGQQASGARKLSMHYDSSVKKRQDLDLRQYLETWEDDEDESARMSEPPLPVGGAATPYIVVECSTLESEAAAKLQERFKPLPSSQDCSTKPGGSSPSSEHKHSNEQPRKEEHTERTIIHSDLHHQTSYAPSMPTLLSDSDKSVNFWNGINKEGDNLIGKGGAFQPLDCSKRDSIINPKVVPQRDSLPPRDIPARKVLCSSEPNSSFDALVSFYGDNRRVSGGYDLVEMSERLMNSSDKARMDHQPSAELGRPCDPRLQQPQHSNNPSIYEKLSPRFSTNNYQHFKSMNTDPYYNYKHPMPLNEKYYGYENSPIINSNYDYNKFVSEFDSAKLHGNKEGPKDPRSVLYPDIQKNPEKTFIEPLSKSSMPNCFQDKTTLEYTSLESEQFLSPIMDKPTDGQSEPCSLKSNSLEDRLNQQKPNFSNVLSAAVESQVQSEKTVLVTSQNGPSDIFRMSYSPKKEIAQTDNVVTLHSGDQTKSNTITVEVPYVQQYSNLVKLSEEMSRSESSKENDCRTLGLTRENKTITEEIKKPTCFKLKRLPNSKEWTVEGSKNSESVVNEGLCSPKSPKGIEDSDVLKTTVSVSNLNMPSLDDIIRDGEENCEVIENHSKTKVSEGVLCSSKTSSQPPQLAIVQPMKLVPCEGKSPEPSSQSDLNDEENKTKQALKAFRAFHSQNLNVASFNNDKPVSVSDCDSQIGGIKTDISKHKNFRSHKKIQGDFSNSFPNCLSSPNEEFSHSEENHSESTKPQYSPFHMYTDCEVNSQIPDFFKIDQRSSSNEKMLDKQIPTSPGVEAMFEDINHSTNSQLCHNQIYQRKSCNFQDLTGPSLPSFDNHNSHFQSFSSIFVDDSNNKGRCDGSVLQMGDKKYFKHLLDDIERQQVSNTLEERVNKLKSNFLNETSNDKACDSKKSPPIPPINLKLSESKKVWCITNKDRHLSLCDLSEDCPVSMVSKSSVAEKTTFVIGNESDQDKHLMEIAPEKTNHSGYRKENIAPSPGKNFNEMGNCDKMEIEPILNQLSSESTDKECFLSKHNSISKDIDTASAQIPFIPDIDSLNQPDSGSTSHSMADLNDSLVVCPLSTQRKEENHCRAVVKYYPKYEILKKHILNKVDSNISQDILIFDERGTHFPHESNDVDGKSIAKDIVELLIKNVVLSREIVDCLKDTPASVHSDILTEPENVISKWDENMKTVIKFDKSSSSSKNISEQKHITKTTEIFIEREKEHNQQLSVIKATQSEKYNIRVDEKNGSLFSPKLDDGEGTILNLNEENTLKFDCTETKGVSDKMDVDAVENSDENQPLDYSIGVTTRKDTSPLPEPTSANVTLSDSSKFSSNTGDNIFSALGSINCCPGGFDVSSIDRSHITENNNSETFSIAKLGNNNCSKDQPLGIDSETELLTDESKKNHYQYLSLNGESSTVEDSLSSDQSNFESDFDISDSEPTNDKEAIAKDRANFMGVNSSNEELDSNFTLRNKQLQTACCDEDEQSTKITVKKTQEPKGQSYIPKVDHLTTEDKSVVPAIFTKDNLENESVEHSSKLTNQEKYLTTKENTLLNSYLKDANTLENEVSEQSLPKKESMESKSKNPRDGCPLKSFEGKRKELHMVKSPYNCHVDEGPIPKFHSDSETSVIVRNNTFTTISNNHCKESSPKYWDKINSNVKNSWGFSIGTSIINKEISDISPKKYETSLLPELKQKYCEDATNKNDINFSEQFNQMTKVSDCESNSSDIAKEDERMEIESPGLLQTPLIPTIDSSYINTPLATKSFVEESNSLYYCVGESIFLNIDEESRICMEKSSSSYLFDFKKRKLLKFCKAVHEPQFSYIKNNANYNRDFSIINFGINVSEHACPSSDVNSDENSQSDYAQTETVRSSIVVISDVIQPISENNHNDNNKTETNHEILDSSDEVNSLPPSECQGNTTDLFKSQLDPPQTFDPCYTDDNNEKPIDTELKSDYSEEEESVVMKQQQNIQLLKRKLCLSQEISSYCVRRDPLKTLGPETVLTDIFSPDPDIEDSESNENDVSSLCAKDKLGLPNSEKLSLAPMTCTSLGPLCHNSRVENKENSVNSSCQNFPDVNSILLDLEKDECLVSTNLDACISDVNNSNKELSKPTAEKDETDSLPNHLMTRHSYKDNSCKEQSCYSCTGSILEENKSKEDEENSTSAIEDCYSLDISSKPLSSNISESHQCFTDSLTHSNQISPLYNSKPVECSNQIIADTKVHSENKFEEQCLDSQINSIEESLSHEQQKTTETLTGSTQQDIQTLSCQISNLDNNLGHTNDMEKTIPSTAIVTGRDVLFSSRFLEDEEDKELHSELQTEHRSRKSSVEEESILDCQNMKINSQDSLRCGSHISSESFPLQCLVEAALALENVDSKQMLLNSSSFTGIYSQSSQSLIKSTIDDVHPNDIEDFSEKNCTNRNFESNICQENKLSAADKEIFSKFEENNYNLRASTKIVTSSSSNIIPYSKRYYRLKSKKLPKPKLDKLNKSENLIKKIQTKKRKDVFTYPRSKRRKKGIKEKPKQRKQKENLHEDSSKNNNIQISSTEGLNQNCENEVVYNKPPSSSNNKIEEKEDCFQSHITNRSAERYDLGSHRSLTEKSNFGGPLIIANENSPVENNIFRVHVHSDKIDDYVNDLNSEGLELLSEHNQSVFKENSIEEQSEHPDVTLENGTSLVIIIEDFAENGVKHNYYNTCKGDSDVMLGCTEGRSPFPQPISVLDYCSDNLASDISMNESCICPSDLNNDKNCDHNLSNDSKCLESKRSTSSKSYEINNDKLRTHERYSTECNQELLTANCYEEINETLVNDIGNWPFVEEEVAEFNTKSDSPNRIPEEGRKIELKCSLPWNKIFNMTKTKERKKKTSHKVSGLELGPAKVEVRLRAPSTEWKVIGDYTENSSPVVKVSRLILQRESETSSYSEKDSEEENENRKMLSPSSVTSELKDISGNNDITKNLIGDESWQPVVLLTRDRELDELTLSKARYKELDEMVLSKTGDKELVELALTLDSQLLSEQSTCSGFSSQSNEDVDKDETASESSVIASEESRVDCNSSKYYKSRSNHNMNLGNVENELYSHCSVERNVNSRNLHTKTEKGCTYETYSPSHNGSQADETIYSPSDPHYSPEPGYPYSDSSSCGNKKKSDMAKESDISHIENLYNSSHEVNIGSFITFNKETIDEENYLHRSGHFKSKNSWISSSTENVNFQDSETSDTNYSSSENQISPLFDGGRNDLPETDSIYHGEVHKVSNQYVRPDLLDTPNIISNETRKSNLKKSVAEENLRKFKRKMPKNFFVRRKSRKNADHQNDATKKMLPEKKQEEVKSGGLSFLSDDDSFQCSTEFEPRQRKPLKSSGVESVPNEWQTRQSSALVEERLGNTKSDLSFVFKDSQLPGLNDLVDSHPMRLNNYPMTERFEDKHRLRDGGRGLKRPCEGHSKEDTKRRRRNRRNHSNKCQECDIQCETKEALSLHTGQDHAITRELHHCLLCQRSFATGARHRLHMQGRSHRHLELTQRHTIHAVHRLLAGQDCPRIPSLSQSELQALQWRPAQPGYSHFYHQLTPLQTVLQEHNSEEREEMVERERRTPND